MASKEYRDVERSFLDTVDAIGWIVIDQGSGVIPLHLEVCVVALMIGC